MCNNIILTAANHIMCVVKSLLKTRQYNYADKGSDLTCTAGV